MIVNSANLLHGALKCSISNSYLYVFVNTTLGQKNN